MGWYRAYIDKKTVQIHDPAACSDETCGHEEGGEHVRVIDGEADTAEAYEKALKLKKNERVGQVVELSDPDQAKVE